MALTLRSKTPIKFEVNDGVVESVVTLTLEDDEQTLVDKLKRVIALVEGPDTPVRAGFDPAVPGLVAFSGPVTGPNPTGLVIPPVTGNGWAAYAPPEVPAHLEGEVELIPPEEMKSE